MKEVLMSPLFWVFFLFCALNRGAGLIMTDLGGTIATAFGAATIMGLIFSPANGVASLLGGVSFDRLGQNRTLLISAAMMVLCGISLVVGNYMSSIFLLLLGLILGGASYGMQMTVAATATRTLFGNKF
jgi:MFS family permease